MSAAHPYSRTISKAPDRLVEGGGPAFGCYDSLSRSPNLGDTVRPFRLPTPSWFNRYRLKEWQAFQFGDDRHFMFTALYNAKAFGLVLAYGYDRLERREYGFRRIFPGPGLGAPASPFASRFAWEGKRERIEYVCDPDGGVFTAKLGWKRRDEAFEGEFSMAFDPASTTPCTVCLPLGGRRAMYSSKVLMPLAGKISLDGAEHRFDPAKASGIIDDHKGYYPYVMRYDWVTGFGFDALGRRVGFNLTRNQVRDPAVYNENVIWIDGRMHALPPVNVTRPRGAENGWIVQDMDGMVDLEFTPEVHHRIRSEALVMASDYDGPFGSFQGVIAPEGIDPVKVDSLYGMGEKKTLRA